MTDYMYLVCCVRDVLSPEFPARLANILFLDFNPSRISILSPPGFFSLQAGALPSRVHQIWFFSEKLKSSWRICLPRV